MSGAHLAKKQSCHYLWSRSWQHHVPSLISGCLSLHPTPCTSIPSHSPSVLPAGMESTGETALRSVACYPIHPAWTGAARSWLARTAAPTDVETSGLLSAKRSSGILVVNLLQASKKIHVKGMYWANFFKDGKKSTSWHQNSLPAKFSISSQEVVELCSKMSVIIFDKQSKTFSTNFVSEAAKSYFFPLFVLAEAFQIKTNKQISP